MYVSDTNGKAVGILDVTKDEIIKTLQFDSETGMPQYDSVAKKVYDAAVAEVGSHRHELTGPLAFAAWLGVHAVLLTTARAKVDAFLEWAWDYFGNAHVDPVLDRPNEMNIDCLFTRRNSLPLVRPAA